MNTSIEFFGLDQAPLDNLQIIEQWEALDTFFPFPWKKEGWNQLYQNWAQHLVVHLKNDSQIIGMALFGVSSDQTAHLYKIVVHPDYRGLGKGHELLENSINKLVAASCISIFLEVEASNISAYQLYLKHKFNNLHLARHFYGEGRHAYKMLRSIP